MTDTSKKDVLVVIPCLNEERYLESLIHGLVKNCAGLPARIVIGDGGSTDRTPQIARTLAQQYSNVIYLHNPKRIQSAAINLAAATYGEEAEYLIRLDAHSEYPPEYCRVLIEEAQATGADAVVVMALTEGPGKFQRAVAAAQNSVLGNGGSEHRSTLTESRWADTGVHALMKIAPYRAVGGYDEDFSHNEDSELDVRLVKAGCRIWLTNKTFLTYHPRSTPKALWLQYYRYGRGRARTIVQHRIVPRLRQILPVGVAPAFLAALLAPFTFWWLALPTLAWAVICLVYGGLLGFRADDRYVALSGPAAILMHLSWSFGFWAGLAKALQSPA